VYYERRDEAEEVPLWTTCTRGNVRSTAVEERSVAGDPAVWRTARAAADDTSVQIPGTSNVLGCRCRAGGSRSTGCRFGQAIANQPESAWNSVRVGLAVRDGGVEGLASHQVGRSITLLPPARNDPVLDREEWQPAERAAWGQPDEHGAGRGC